MKTKLNQKINLVLLSLMLPAFGYSQAPVTNDTSYFSNPLFNIMLGVIILLLIIIVVLAQSLKNLGKSDFLTRKNYDSGKTKISAIIFFTLLAGQANAQISGNHSWSVGGIDILTFFILISIILIEFIFIAVLINTFQYLMRSEQMKDEVEQLKKEKSILEILNASVEIEQESEILMDHDYDGIRELDNNLPPWWKYGFYLTIIVAFIYLIHFHISGTGDLQIAEYNKEVEKGKMEVAEFMKQSANNVDESSVKMMKGEDLTEGKNIFISTCAACHGKLGEGGVGPNLTDSAWINGGSIVDIFKVIKYGKPDKGMKSWKEDISPIQIAQVASFIKTLLNTNPPNAKAKQGDIYIEKDMPKSDSTSINKDSIQVLPVLTETPGAVAELNKK